MLLAACGPQSKSKQNNNNDWKRGSCSHGCVRVLFTNSAVPSDALFEDFMI